MRRIGGRRRRAQRREGVEAGGDAGSQPVGEERPLVEVFDGWNDRPRPDEAERSSVLHNRAWIERTAERHGMHVVVSLRRHRNLDVYADVRLAGHEPHLFVAQTPHVDDRNVADQSGRCSGGRRVGGDRRGGRGERKRGTRKHVLLAGERHLSAGDRR